MFGMFACLCNCVLDYYSLLCLFDLSKWTDNISSIK
uniref:Uncharacterized protein n=1 Tax=Setaria viridis TaxID=4556 RepID=A0A4U6U935_SETVI|nr:hypothetical protein SEVIR_6G212533v2 [Setaria viridis]